jgi:antitoxin MazE
MLRRIFRIGNNLVISLPKDLLESLGLQEGAEVLWDLDWQNRQLLIRPAKGLTEKFVSHVDEFIETYRPAWNP